MIDRPLLPQRAPAKLTPGEGLAILLVCGMALLGATLVCVSLYRMIHT